MPIVSLSPEFLKLRAEKLEKIKERKKLIANKKITLIFKKEYVIGEKGFIKNLARDLHLLSSNNLYDEIYIVKDDKILNENSIKEIYSYIRKKEKEHIKEVTKNLASAIGKLINIIEIMKNK